MNKVDLKLILQTYKRFRENSALVNEHRDLIEDYTSTEKWIRGLFYEESTDDVTKKLLLVLLDDARYLTTQKCIERKYKYSQTSGWDRYLYKEGKIMVGTLTDACRVGDFQKRLIMLGNLEKFLWFKLGDGNGPVKISLLQRLIIDNKEQREFYKNRSCDVDILLHINKEDGIWDYLAKNCCEEEDLKLTVTVDEPELLDEYLSSIDESSNE